MGHAVEGRRGSWVGLPLSVSPLALAVGLSACSAVPATERSDESATGTARQESALVTSGGALFLPRGNLHDGLPPIPQLPLPSNIWDLLDEWVKEAFAGKKAKDLPNGQPTCDCKVLAMEPPQIPLGRDTFEPGEDIQSVLLCDGQRVETVSLSNFIPTLELYFLQGVQFNVVNYGSSNPAVATISDYGLITAKAPGTAEATATIWTFQASKAGLCLSLQGADIPNVTVTCPAGTENCAGKCVDTQSDPLNCGACGVACDAGQPCSTGTCACPDGTELCGGRCVSDSCYGGQNFNPATCLCECPEGATWDASSGQCLSPRLCPTAIRITGAICQCFVNNPWGSAPNTYIDVGGIADIAWTTGTCSPALSFGASMVTADGSTWSGQGQLFAAYYSESGPFNVGTELGAAGLCGDSAIVAGQSITCQRMRYDCQGFVCTPVPD